MWIAIIIISLVVVFDVVVYNRLIRTRNLVAEAWSGIDVQLKRRHDLIPNLVEAVKGYGQHERTLFEDVAQKRSDAIGAGTPSEKGQAESELTRQVKSLFAVAEAYPDLKASSNFIELQKGLTEVEDQIQYARRYYNGAVRDYNILVQSFPNNLLAKPLGFQSKEFFEIELATEREAPKVDMQ